MPNYRRYAKKYAKRRAIGYAKKRWRNRKRGGYRKAIARIARPLNVKPRSAVQNVTYYNSFLCKPVLNSAATATNKQQNFSFILNLNSLWPFNDGFDANASTAGQILTPNAPITGYNHPVTSAMTTMPNVRDGANLFDEYAQCAVVGTKVTLVATPTENTGNQQMGYLYAVKHSQNATGLTTTSTITDLNTLPYRQMAKLKGAYQNPTSSAQASARIVVTHSPKRFNNIKDIRDNSNLFCHTGSNTSAKEPNEGDHLTIGTIPALNGRDLPVTDFCLQIRVEQKLLWTEPLENISAGSGNYSFPRPAGRGFWRGAMNTGLASAGAAMYAYAF